jgi:hypothetical protein
MPRRRRTTPQIGTAGFTPLDVPADTSIEDLDPDPTTGLLPPQEDELEKTPALKRRTRKGGTSTDRK